MPQSNVNVYETRDNGKGRGRGETEPETVAERDSEPGRERQTEAEKPTRTQGLKEGDREREAEADQERKEQRVRNQEEQGERDTKRQKKKQRLKNRDSKREHRESKRTAQSAVWEPVWRRPKVPGVQMTETLASWGVSRRPVGPKTERLASHSPRVERVQAQCAPRPGNATSSPPGPVKPRPGQVHGTTRAAGTSLQLACGVKNMIRNSALTFLNASLEKYLRKDGPWGNNAYKACRSSRSWTAMRQPGRKCYSKAAY